MPKRNKRRKYIQSPSDVLENTSNIFLYKKFRKLLKDREIDLTVFCRVLGISRSRIYRWRDGLARPTAAELALISIALNLPTYTEFVNVVAIKRGYVKWASANTQEALELRSAKTRAGSTVKKTHKRASGILKKALNSEDHLNLSPEYAPSESGNNIIRSSLCSFPVIQGVMVPHNEVTHPSYTEKNEAGLNCTFEIHVDRIYLRRLNARDPNFIVGPSPKIPSFALIIKDPKGRVDSYGDYVYVFYERPDLIYDWKRWDILSIPVLKYLSNSGHKSVVEWYNEVNVDDGIGWLEDKYKIDYYDDAVFKGIEVKESSKKSIKKVIPVDELEGEGKVHRNSDGVSFTIPGDLDFSSDDDDDITSAEERDF